MDRSLKMFKLNADMLFSSAQNVMDFMSGSERQTESEQLKAILRDQIRMEHEFKARFRAQEQLHEKLRKIPDLELEQEYESIYQREVAQDPLNEAKMNQHPYFVRLMAILDSKAQE